MKIFTTIHVEELSELAGANSHAFNIAAILGSKRQVVINIVYEQRPEKLQNQNTPQ